MKRPRAKSFAGRTLHWNEDQRTWSTGYAVSLPWITLGEGVRGEHYGIVQLGVQTFKITGASERAVRARILNHLRVLKEALRRLKL